MELFYGCVEFLAGKKYIEYVEVFFIGLDVWNLLYRVTRQTDYRIPKIVNLRFTLQQYCPIILSDYLS